MDNSAAIITKNQVGVSLFQDAWSSVAPPSLARHVGSIPVPKTHEELVNHVASLLFRSPTYVRRYEVAILHPKRQTNVFEARVCLEDTIAKYYRLCTRWSHPFHLSDIRCIEMALQSLPSTLEEDIRAFYQEPEWDEVWRRAEFREERLSPSKTYLAFPAFVNPLTQDEVMREAPAAPVRKRDSKPPPSPCPGCNGNHWRKDCPYRKTICFQCQLPGHLKSSCPNFALKDARGRVSTRVEAKPSGVSVHQRKDRTVQDQMTTAEATISTIRDKAERRSKHASAKRYDKRVAEGKKVRPRGQVQLAADGDLRPEEESSDESSDDSSVEDALCALENVFLASSSQPEDHSVVIVTATINGFSRPVVADTGASRTLISKEHAQELNIQAKEGGVTRFFDGLGSKKGIQSQPASVAIGNRVHNITFYIVDKPGLPVLLSRCDLALYQVLVDPDRGQLLDRSTLEVVAVSVEQHLLLNQRLNQNLMSSPRSVLVPLMMNCLKTARRSSWTSSST